VVGDRIEDLASKRLSKASLVSVSDVRNVVVLSAILEDGELTVKILVPVVQGEVVLLDLLHQSDSQILSLFSLENLLVVGIVELKTETIHVHVVGEFVIGDLVDEGTVFVTGSSGKRVENTLGEGTLLVLKLRLLSRK